MTNKSWLPACTTLKLFSAEECRKLMKLVYSKGFYQARRLSDDGDSYVDMSHRNCGTAHFAPGEELHSIVSSRIMDRLDQINERFSFDLHSKVEDMIPVVNVNRYDGTQRGRIGLHTDTGPHPAAEDRKLSVSMLLTDAIDYRGGSLTLHDGLEHQPLDGALAGTAAIFPGFVMHEVKPVTDGVRYGCVVWLRGPRFR
jgi:PKHD-type hydroxylase